MFPKKKNTVELKKKIRTEGYLRLEDERLIFQENCTRFSTLSAGYPKQLQPSDENQNNQKQLQPSDSYEKQGTGYYYELLDLKESDRSLCSCLPEYHPTDSNNRTINKYKSPMGMDRAAMDL